MNKRITKISIVLKILMYVSFVIYAIYDVSKIVPKGYLLYYILFVVILIGQFMVIKTSEIKIKTLKLQTRKLIAELEGRTLDRFIKVYEVLKMNNEIQLLDEYKKE